MRDYLLNSVLRNPFGILFVNYLVADALGADIVASLAVFAIDSRFAGIFDTQGIYGELHGSSSIWVLLQRMFRLSFVFTITPMFIISLVYWAAICLCGRRLIWKLTNRQRWTVVCLMQAIPLLFFLFEISRFPQMVLFAGPIHGFHPLTPLLKTFFQLSVPLLFWWFISRLNRFSPSFPANSKGN
jgi:hypothetical protein